VTQPFRPSRNDSDVLIEVENVWKKYCLNFKWSMWYGLRDLCGGLLGRDRNGKRLRRHEFFAVQDADFQIRRGECVGLVGRNGAGKTTLLKMINGLIPPDGGRITVRGRVGALIALGTGFNPVLTGRENIYVNAAVLGIGKKEVDRKLDDIIAFAEIDEFIDTPVYCYSSGMTVRLGFAVAVHMRPDILLVDEVLAVGDTAFRMKCFKHILKLKSEGVSIVMVTHNMIDVARVCDRVLVLKQGRVLHDTDVPRGIAAYEATLAPDGKHPRGEKREDAWIESVEHVNAKRPGDTDYETGDEIRLRFRIGASKFIPRTRLIVHLESMSTGMLGSVASPYRGNYFDLRPGLNTIELRYPNNPLLLGSYYFFMALYGQEITQVYHQVFAAAPFSIVGPMIDTFGYGVHGNILFDHHWHSREGARGDRSDSEVPAPHLRALPARPVALHRDETGQSREIETP
jgi:lipopolysaccharide transport system ATP-binding protein